MLPDPYVVKPVDRPLQMRPRLPGSKSITNRALVLAALADGTSCITNALMSDDTRYMAAALRSLGFDVTTNEIECRITVSGCGGRIPAAEASLYVGNAGTAARFLTPVLALGHGQYRLDGNERMRQRPIEPLLRALRDLGVDARSENNTGCPPIVVRSAGLPGGTAVMDASVSSQFLSALLMASPSARSDVVLTMADRAVSEPYVRMTVQMMQDWSLRVVGAYRVPAPQYRSARDYSVEPDASAASYFMAAAAITGGSVRIDGLGSRSLQGDIAFANVLAEMGCAVTWEETAVTVEAAGELRGVEVDMNAISDTVMSLAVVAPFATSPTTIRNVGHIRVKECDRIGALAAELRRVGVQVAEHEDGLTVYPSHPHGAIVETYDDHRMAMSLALIGLRVDGIGIRNPACVSKTFPAYFEELERVSAGGDPDRSSQTMMPE